jgi:hypothetical protein
MIPGGVNDRAPLLATLYVGFVDPSSGVPVQAYDEDGAETEGMVGRVPLISSGLDDTETGNLTPAEVRFDDSIRLAGYAYPGIVEGQRQTKGSGVSSVVVRLLWEAGGRPQDEYGLAHLVGPGGVQTGFDRRLRMADSARYIGKKVTASWATSHCPCLRICLLVATRWVGLYRTGSREAFGRKCSTRTGGTDDRCCWA